MGSKSSQSKFYFVGNDRCLDFINTEVKQGGQPVDLLTEFADLLEWLGGAGILEAVEVKELAKRWAGTAEARTSLERAHDLRKTLRAMIERIVAGKPVPSAALAAINELLREWTGYAEIERGKGGFEKRFRIFYDEPLRLLAPIAESAGDLLCYADFALIRKCKNAACVLFFYDTTKNHKRRWCSMNVCGNRAKAAAHYQRARSSNSTR